MDFAALHIRSGFSFLQTGITLENAFNAAIKNKYVGFGLTDLNTLTGYPELNSLSKSKNLKCVYGLDITYQDDVLSLYCLEEEGYRNLLEISFEYSTKPITPKFLRDHCDGLALILDASKSKLATLTKEEEIRDYLKIYNVLFVSFMIGLPYGEQYDQLNEKVRNFVTKYPYDLVAFPHMLYEKKEDAIILEILTAIKNDTILKEKKCVGNNYFLSLDDISAFYKEDEIKNTTKLLNHKFVFETKRGTLLKYENSQGLSSKNLLREKSIKGLKAKKGEIAPNYQTRLDYELSIIDQMGYNDYFLVVIDYINGARNKGIYVGPGRGSGAGSLVAYALDITKVDPLEYGLLFERFLNPQRQSMPDLDVDFSDYRRDEVEAYLKNKYGINRVAKIVTMQKLAAKGAIRDIGRVFNVPDRDIDMLCKAVVDVNKNLRENYKISKDLKMLVDSEPQYLEIVALASKIETFPRQSGVHGPGIILNNENLLGNVPLKYDPQLGLIAQFEHDYLEAQGFLKMDLLALRNLSIVERCIDLIKYKKDIELDYTKIPFNDPKAIKTIADLNVMGLFQLESYGMRNAIRRIKPTCFDDIVAVISLFRPGPMEEIDTYARRKYGKEKIQYLVPEIEPILKSTYGVIVYQEQVMMIAQTMAGFSYGEADLLRRAIAKKDASKLDAMKKKFFDGCLKKKYPLSTIESAYKLIYKFADYGFNKSHGVAYAMLACQMAYLKTYYPNEFYSSILDFNHAIGDADYTRTISEMKKIGLKLANPSVNFSSINYSVLDNKVLLPFTAIEGINFDFAKAITVERYNEGDFKDFFDFVVRMKKYGITQKILVRLIDSGALDCLDTRRATLRASSFDAVNYAEMFYGENGDRILLDFNMPKPSLKIADEDEETNLIAEKQAIKMMLSSSPLSRFRKLDKYKNLSSLSSLNEMPDFSKYLAIVDDCRVITTKKGTSMCRLHLYDEDTTIELVAFQKTYDEAYPLLKKDKLVLATIKKDALREDSYVLIKLENLNDGETNG